MQENRFQSYEITNELRLSSDQLTQAARAYVITGEPQFRDYFSEILDIRHGRVPRPTSYDSYMWHFGETVQRQGYETTAPISVREIMENLNFTGQELSLLRVSHRRSDWLSIIETETMASVDRLRNVNSDLGEEKNTALLPAIQSLFSERYFQDKAAIMAPLQAIYESVDSRTRAGTEAASRRLKNLLIADSFMVVLLIGTMIAINYNHHISAAKVVRQMRQKMRQYDDDFLHTTQKYNEAMRSLNRLASEIPICSLCRKVKTEAKNWKKFEHFVNENPDKFNTNGYCIECAKSGVNHAQIKSDTFTSTPLLKFNNSRDEGH